MEVELLKNFLKVWCCQKLSNQSKPQDINEDILWFAHIEIHMVLVTPGGLTGTLLSLKFCIKMSPHLQQSVAEGNVARQQIQNLDN